MPERHIVPDRTQAAIQLSDVSIRVPGRTLLAGVNWRVEYGEHWVVLGRNGAGKSTMLSMASAERHPSAGTASVLGHRLGRVDLRELRSHLGLVTTGQRLLDAENATAHTVVLTGHTGTIQPLWDRYDEEVRARARAMLADVGCAELTDRPIRVCSQGERARVRIARALMADPALLLLDEPFAGLDLPAREDLIDALHNLALTRPELTTVLVTHHLEEIPETATHAVLVRDGAVLTSGALDAVLTGERLSACFGRPLRVHHQDGRWSVQTARQLI
ncbi:MAG: iron complex transport system ATP-binding protein [Streptosporangiaceae bacterium]|jgi:iron complex transport system ATP-binding protein|nr:iron complex transport system ATP-binding protein [Streptosporangiaceae bacterium]